MKFRGVTPDFKCALAGVGTCTEDRARWASGYWSDVCQRHMDVWISNVGRAERQPWTGRKNATG